MAFPVIPEKWLNLKILAIADMVLTGILLIFQVYGYFELFKSDEATIDQINPSECLFTDFYDGCFIWSLH